MPAICGGGIQAEASLTVPRYLRVRSDNKGSNSLLERFPRKGLLPFRVEVEAEGVSVNAIRESGSRVLVQPLQTIRKRHPAVTGCATLDDKVSASRTCCRLCPSNLAFSRLGRETKQARHQDRHAGFFLRMAPAVPTFPPTSASNP